MMTSNLDENIGSISAAWGIVPECRPEERAEFGVLFVDGFTAQARGGAVAALAAALYGWLFRWNQYKYRNAPRTRPYRRLLNPERWNVPEGSEPRLNNAILSSTQGASDSPAHLTLDVPLQLTTGKRNASWLLAESSWAGLFSSPGFLGLARWIWEVSTCLLVLQFVIPMHRYWTHSRVCENFWHRWAVDRVLVLSTPPPSRGSWTSGWRGPCTFS